LAQRKIIVNIVSYSSFILYTYTDEMVSWIFQWNRKWCTINQL